MARGLIAASLALATLTAAAGAEAGQTMSARGNYVLLCSGCHGIGGAGSAAGGIPSFHDSVGKIAATDRGRTYMMHVPGVVSNALSDAGIAGVMTYILETWGAGAAPFTPEEVTLRRARPVPDVVAERREIAAELAARGLTIAAYPWP